MGSQASPRELRAPAPFCAKRIPVVLALFDRPPLSYYAGGFAHTTQTTVAQLLRDGNGQCGAWADLLESCWRTQGIGTGDMVLVEADIWRQMGFIVRNWTFSGNGTSTQTSPYVYVLHSDVTDTTGVAGQNNPDPESVFALHYVVRFGRNQIYDPSYGLGPFSSQLEWETQAIAGFLADASDWQLPAQWVVKLPSARR